MKIDITLDIASIEQAREQIKKAKRLFQKNGKIIREFAEYACEWIIQRANDYINNADLGELVKLNLRNAWEYTLTPTGAKIINTAKKVKPNTHTPEGSDPQLFKDTVYLAVLVEFGVGIVGEQNQHPNAIAEGYVYDIPTDYKDSSGMWYFWTNHNELDIPRSAIEDIRGYDDFRGRKNEKGKRIIVGTRGTEGVMFAYNAVVDAQQDMRNPNGQLAQEWKRLLERYLG